MNESGKIEKEIAELMIRNVEEQRKRGDYTYMSEEVKQAYKEVLDRGFEEQRILEEERLKISNACLRGIWYRNLHEKKSEVRVNKVSQTIAQDRHPERHALEETLALFK